MCTDERHEYSEQRCSKCGETFCWSCCGGTNVHHGGKYEPDYMLCPKCGYDILKDEE
jgi:DNA-directed RNA polymerase subunit RPC12/RpoP